MIMRYKFTDNTQTGLRYEADNGVAMIIPTDPANTDYQEYLKWVAEGNEPEPADE